MEELNSVQRRIKQEQLRRKARRGEITLRRIYKFIRFIFILFLFYALYRTANSHFWYFPSDVYSKPLGERIEILGNDIVPSDKILNKMKNIALPKKPIYKIDPTPIEKEIEKLTPIKRAYIRRYWLPARLIVMIEELNPALTIAPSEEAPEVAAFAFTGELIPRDYLPLPQHFKTVKILSYGNKDDDYEQWDKEKINNLYKLVKLIEQYAGEKVLYLDIRNPHNAFVQLESVKLKLGEIDISAFERIKAVHHIIPEIKQVEQKIKYVDLSWKDSIYIKLDNKN